MKNKEQLLQFKEDVMCLEVEPLKCGNWEVRLKSWKCFKKLCCFPDVYIEDFYLVTVLFPAQTIPSFMNRVRN